MSYWIEYQAAAFMLPADELGADQARYVVATEGGSNNSSVRDRDGRERRTRDWSIAMIGTQVQVLRQTVRIAAECEGYGLRLKGRACTPEAYIGRIRRLLRHATPDFRRHVVLSPTVPDGHELVPVATAAGYVVYPDSWLGETRVKLIPQRQDETHWSDYFSMLDPYLDAGSLQPLRLGEVFGLPSS